MHLAKQHFNFKLLENDSLLQNLIHGRNQPKSLDIWIISLSYIQSVPPKWGQLRTQFCNFKNHIFQKTSGDQQGDCVSVHNFMIHTFSSDWVPWYLELLALGLCQLSSMSRTAFWLIKFWELLGPSWENWNYQVTQKYSLLEFCVWVFQHFWCTWNNETLWI